MHLGRRPGPLQLDLRRGFDFTDSIELRDSGGAPLPWPVGTAAWFRVWAPGTGFEETWPISVAGSLLTWTVAAAVVDEVPDNADVQLILDYPGDAPPLVWKQGKAVFGCD